ncbi:MAG: hypothetical protein NTU44_05260 [Bacteroidetes bacterium]|nr:hypothetical protein [Bacteroidota bacterium]
MGTDKQLIRYNSSDGKAEIDVNLANETVWLSLNDLVVLFDRDKSVISRHIGNIFKENELDKESTVAKFATVHPEGGREIRRDIEYFNLDVMASESKSEEKDIMIKLVFNLIIGNNKEL